MKIYFDVVPKFKETQSTGSSSGVNSNDPPLVNEELDQVIAESEANLAYNLPEQHEDFESLEADPGLRKRIVDFHPNVQDETFQLKWFPRRSISHISTCIHLL
ncbi:unnamed protein product, partial [Cuscuta europaea]